MPCNSQSPYRSKTTHGPDPYEPRHTGRQEAYEEGWIWVFCNFGACLVACILSECKLLPQGLAYRVSVLYGQLLPHQTQSGLCCGHVCCGHDRCSLRAVEGNLNTFVEHRVNSAHTSCLTLCPRSSDDMHRKRRRPAMVWVKLCRKLCDLSSPVFLPCLLLPAPTGLSFSITWLAYTACPRQRARNARCMNKQTPGCMTYTWDLAWDIILMAWWLCLFAVVMPLTPYTVIRSPWFMVYYTLCALMWMLFLISAVLSGLVRKRLLMSQKCEKDIVAHKCDVELGQHPGAGECDLTPPGVHCEVTRAAEPAVGVVKE